MCQKIKSLNSCRHCNASKIVILIGLQSKIKVTAARMQKSSDTTRTITCTSILDLTTQSTLSPNSQGANSLEKKPSMGPESQLLKIKYQEEKDKYISESIS